MDMKPLSQKIRLHYLDRGKAVAMLFVVFGHINLFCIYGNEMINGCKVSNYTSILQLTLFMFLSGIVVSTEGLTIREGGNVILKKGKQLLIPFFVVGSIFAYFFCKKDIWSLIYNSPKLGYWYLWVLFLFYITHILYQVIICNANRSIVKDLLYGGGHFLFVKRGRYYASCYCGEFYEP